MNRPPSKQRTQAIAAQAFGLSVVYDQAQALRRSMPLRLKAGLPSYAARTAPVKARFSNASPDSNTRRKAKSACPGSRSTRCHDAPSPARLPS